MAKDSQKKDRVWQFIPTGDPNVSNTAPKLITFQRDEGSIDGTTVPALTIVRRPNPAQQYVVPTTSPEFESECDKMEFYAKKHGLKELDFSEGDQVGSVPERMRPKPPESQEVKALREENAEKATELESLREEKAALVAAQEEMKARLAELEEKSKKKQ